MTFCTLYAVDCIGGVDHEMNRIRIYGSAVNVVDMFGGPEMILPQMPPLIVNKNLIKLKYLLDFYFHGSLK